MSLDSARSLDFHLQQIEQLEQAEQQQRAAAAAAAAPPGEGRLRKLEVAVLGASSPSLVDAIDRVTAGPAPSPAGAARSQGLPPSHASSLQHSRKSSGSSLDMELAVVALPHDSAGPSSSSSSSSSAWGSPYAGPRSSTAGGNTSGSGSGSGAWGAPYAGPSSSHTSSMSSFNGGSGGTDVGAWAAAAGGSNSRYSGMV